MSEEFKHPAAMMAEWKERGDHDFAVQLGTEAVYTSDDVDEAFKVFFYLNKHQEYCEDDEGELLQLSLVAVMGDSVVIVED